MQLHKVLDAAQELFQVDFIPKSHHDITGLLRDFRNLKDAELQ